MAEGTKCKQKSHEQIIVQMLTEALVYLVVSLLQSLSMASLAAELLPSHESSNSSLPESTGRRNSANHAPYGGKKIATNYQFKPSKRTQFTIIPWIFEIAAIIVSIGANVAIIVILYLEDGKPQAAWNFVLTLSTVISALGTLARTSLIFALSACIGQQKWNWLSKKSDSLVAFEMFDEASRGPWGSSRLFLWLRGRQVYTFDGTTLMLIANRHWAALGALAVIGTTAFDPFLQAVLTTHGQLDDASQHFNATIGQALMVDNKKPKPSKKLARIKHNTVVNYPRASAEVIGSVFDGLYNVSTSRVNSMSSSCITGNCTWPIFSSVAVCSSCEEISDFKIVKTFLGPGIVDTTYEIPYARITSHRDNATKDVEPKLTANATFIPSQSIKFHNLTTFLTSVAVMRFHETRFDSYLGPDGAYPTATECVLYLCTKAYSTKTILNSLEEKELQSWVSRDPDSYRLNRNSADNEVYLQQYRTNQSSWEAQAVRDSRGGGLWDRYITRTNLRLIIPFEQSRRYPKEMNREFNVTDRFIQEIIEHFVTLVADPKGQIVYNPTGKKSKTTIIDALWESRNLTVTFSNLARSLTNHMRRNSQAKHQGSTLQWVIHVRVRWWYLAYPIGMLGMAIVYVGLVLWESMVLGLPAWKEDMEPTLAYGLDEETQKVVRAGPRGHKVRVKFGWDEEQECKRLLAV